MFLPKDFIHVNPALEGSPIGVAIRVGSSLDRKYLIRVEVADNDPS